MLQPDDRAAFTEALRPPAGYTLVRAVGTTFTLDMISALLVPLNAMGARLAGDTDDAAVNPVAVMEAARSAAAKIDVFCQCGQITVPPAPGLISLLEPMIHPVTVAQPMEPRMKPGTHRLFHPKLWVLQFSEATARSQAVGGQESEHFRLICSSRNLTGDTGWDAVIVLDGHPGRRNTANDPVRDLLGRIPDFAINPLPTERRHGIGRLAEALKNVQWETPDGVDDVAFHIYGPHKRTKPPDLDGRRRLIISPFVTDRGLAPLLGPQTTLLARPNQLDRLSPGIMPRFDALVPDDDLAPSGQPDDHNERADAAVSAAPAGSVRRDAVARNENGFDELSGLHAKVYVADKGNADGRRTSHAYIGSANATESAFRRNVEVLVELIGSSARIGAKATIDHLLDGPFAHYRPSHDEQPPEDDDTMSAMQSELLTIAATPFVATVRQVGGGPHHFALDLDAVLTFDDTAYQLTAHPVGAPGVGQRLTSDRNDGIRLGPLDLISVTPFFVLTLTEREGSTPTSARCVVRADLREDRPERLDAIQAAQLDTAEKFHQYLMLMLARDAEQSGDELQVASALADFSIGFAQPGLFESLLQALGAGGEQTPETIAEIDRVIARLTGRTKDPAPATSTQQPDGTGTSSGAEPDIIPDGFEALWESIRKAYGRRRPAKKVTQ